MAVNIPNSALEKWNIFSFWLFVTNTQIISFNNQVLPRWDEGSVFPYYVILFDNASPSEELPYDGQGNNWFAKKVFISVPPQRDTDIDTSPFEKVIRFR